jgi:large subunit ribosomal protein L27
MGRDHTIFALAKGFVRYYRDPGRPGAAGEKKYIGVVFDQTMKLPRGRNEARRRRLGMEMSTMAQIPEGETESTEELPTATEVSKSTAGSKNSKTASPPNVPPVTLRPGYTYMESNWSIGRAAERAGVKVRTYKPNNRFLAWRKATLRRAKNAELRGLSRKNKK